MTPATIARRMQTVMTAAATPDAVVLLVETVAPPLETVARQAGVAAVVAAVVEAVAVVEVAAVGIEPGISR